MGSLRMNRSFLLEMQGRGDQWVRVASRGKGMGLKDIYKPCAKWTGFLGHFAQRFSNQAPKETLERRVFSYLNSTLTDTVTQGAGPAGL